MKMTFDFGDSSFFEVFDKPKNVQKIFVDDDVSGSAKEHECGKEMNVTNTSVNITEDSSLINGNGLQQITTDYVEKLEKELKHLKNLLQKSSYYEANADVVAHVTYFNNDSSRKMKLLIEQQMTQILSKSSETASSGTDKKVLSDCTKDKCKASGRCTYLKDYIIDTHGLQLVQDNPQLTPGWEIPRYEQVYKNIFGEDDKNKLVLNKRSKPSCFNCGDDHNVSSCPKEKNIKRINNNINNRNSFFINNSNNNTLQRYHEDGSKFANMKAGLLSDKLKEALGMKENELPPYIYLMRLLGYPPGHLESARISGPGMTMFGKHGREIAEDGELLEDGELGSDDFERAGPYKMENIIDYPGFNVQPPSNAIDIHKKMNMPGMQPFHIKKFMVDYLNSKFSNKDSASRKRPADLNEASRKKKKFEKNASVVDMDIDDDGGNNGVIKNGLIHPSITATPVSGHQFNIPKPPPTPPRQLLLPPPPPPPETTPEEGELPYEGSNHHQEEDMQNATNNEEVYVIIDDDDDGKNVIHDGSIIVVLDGDDNNSGTEDEGEILDGVDVKELQISNSSQISNNENTLSVSPQLTSTPVICKSISIDLGTPMMNDESPKSLPCLEKFAMGIGPMLFREEAPQSTGNFKQIKELLKRVRKQGGS